MTLCAANTGYQRILMCAGVGLFGTFSGFLAAWFLAEEERSEASEIAAVRTELSGLRHLLENMQSERSAEASSAKEL